MGDDSTTATVEICGNTVSCNVAQISNDSVQKITYKLGGKYCIARWCNNSRRTNPDVTLFRLPVKDKDRSLQWLKNANREDLVGRSLKYLHALRLCDKHFTSDMFMNVARKRLNCRAVPSLFSKPEIVQQIDEKRLRTDLSHYNADDGSQLQRKQPRPILPKISGLSMSNAVLKTDLSKSSKSTISPQCVNLCADTESEPSVSESEKFTWKDYSNILGTFSMSSRHAESESESLFCHSLDREPTFSETDSMCTDHSFQKWDDTVYPCPSCGEMFLVRSNLVRHQTMFHSERSVHCDLCGMLVLSKSEFLEHVCINYP